jgi:Uma2 family endonuclease
MQKFARPYYTEEEYRRMEENSVEKHEYYKGEILLRAGGSEPHNLISSNTLIEIGSQLRGKDCRAYNSDMRVKVEANGLETYPDVSVVCGDPTFVEDRKDVITNPILIVKVVSPSSEKYDRSQKFELYRAIPTFEHYLIIDQQRVYVEYHHKTGPNKWEMEIFTDLNQTLQLEKPDIAISLTNLYDKIKFEA